MTTLLPLGLWSATSQNNPQLPVFGNWQSTNYTGEVHLSGQQLKLAGSLFFQKDGPAGYNRSAYVARNKYATSTMADWDGKTTGLAATYFHDSSSCLYWCPVDSTTANNDQCNDGSALCSYDQLHHAKYVKDDVIDNTPVEVFFWPNKLGPIVMANSTLNLIKTTQTPFTRTQYLTPFGRYEGYSFQTYGEFKNGTPENSAWNLPPNTSKCQQGSEAQCGSSFSRSVLHVLGGFQATLYDA